MGQKKNRGTTLSEYPLHFEDIPEKRYNKKVKALTGKKKEGMKMSASKEVKQAKKYSKTRGEHIKDLVIVALVTGVIAFGLGIKFQSDRNAEMQSAVKEATAVSASADPVKK